MTGAFLMSFSQGNIRNSQNGGKFLLAYSKRNKIVIRYFNTEAPEPKNAEIYIERYKAKLEKDTSYK